MKPRSCGSMISDTTTSGWNRWTARRAWAVPLAMPQTVRPGQWLIQLAAACRMSACRSTSRTLLRRRAASLFGLCLIFRPNWPCCGPSAAARVSSLIHAPTLAPWPWDAQLGEVLNRAQQIAEGGQSIAQDHPRVTRGGKLCPEGLQRLLAASGNPRDGPRGWSRWPAGRYGDGPVMVRCVSLVFRSYSACIPLVFR